MRPYDDQNAKTELAKFERHFYTSVNYFTQKFFALTAAVKDDIIQL